MLSINWDLKGSEAVSPAHAVLRCLSRNGRVTKRAQLLVRKSLRTLTIDYKNILAVNEVINESK